VRLLVDVLSPGSAILNRAREAHWILLALALFFLGLSLELAHDVLFDLDDRDEVQAWDERILQLVAAHRSGALTKSMIDVTALGSVTVIALMGIVLVGVFLLIRDRLAILQLALASLGAGVWTWTFKAFAERPRPSVVPPLVEAWGDSFPSGHSLASAALYLTFATMAGRHLPSWRHAVALQGLAALVIACVAFSRVYLGVHYPSDVLSGALFGAAWAYLVAGGVGWLGAARAEPHMTPKLD
jgi:undecaprenyl-diphosphatase